MFIIKKRGNKAQITVFVILAIVILLTLMFLMFVKIIIDKEKYQVLAKKQVQEYINKNSLNIYVTDCMDSIANEAIILASLQGGIINTSNKTLGIDYVRYYVPEYNRTVNVFYAVKENNCSVIYSYPWEYPYPRTRIYPIYNLKNVYNANCKYTGNVYDYNSGFFGKNILALLCNYNGSNKYNATGSAYGLLTCEADTYNNPVFPVKTIQEDIESFVETEIEKCVDFERALNITSSNITKIGKPKATLTFGRNSFNLKVNYPFTISYKGHAPIQTFYEFSINKNIRFKELYDYVFYSIRTDVEEAGFNQVNDKISNYNLERTYKGYIIERNKSINADHVDIIRVIDNKSYILNKPLIFQFAVKNRRPALEFINDYSGNLQVDLIFQENDTIKIKPQGYDPDDDILEYNYSLWKEDYDEMYNMSDPNCVNPTSIAYVKQNCSIKINVQPKNFTNSTEFQSTRQNATYTLQEWDKGYHKLNISVREIGRQKLHDWQEVEIFVFDKPTANITANNNYSDIPDNFASVEDPYILSGANSIIGLSALPDFNNNFSSFEWNDSMGEFYVIIPITSDNNKTLKLPVDLNGSISYNISLITKYVFNKTGLRNITLKVNTRLGLFDTTNFEVNVKQCLPHRNNTNPSYPYNSLTFDFTNAYFADHTCCDNNYNIKDTSNSCYNQIRYGSNRSFNNPQYSFWYRQPEPPSPINIIYQGIINRADNDIWIQNFTRYCSGTRGNTCTGPAQDVRRVYEQCNDNNYNTNPLFQRERCQGPPTININQPSLTPITCFNYTRGYSFEQQIGTGTGVCTLSPQCANPVSNDPFNSNDKRYLCNGYCDGKGGCASVIPSSCTCSVSCGSNLACNGLTYPGNGAPLNNVIYCSSGNSLYEDTCNNCMLTDKNPRICRINLPGRIGCNAPSPQCDGQFANSIINNNNEGCTLACEYRNCGLYAYSVSLGNCLSSCSIDEHCSSQARCCTQERIIANECTLQNTCYIPS
ncbi:MAG: hypothetical protein QXK76_03075 [Candidatus Woesearchaeota archaeon]